MTSYFEEGTVGVQAANYDNMSLDEACWTAREEFAEICNEARVQVLMNEYAYLVENGVEVDYSEEANFFTEAEDGEKEDKPAKMKNSWINKIGRMIKAFLAKVKQLFDRFILWVGTNIKSFITKHSVNNAKISEYVAAANGLTSEDKAVAKYLSSVKFIPTASAKELFTVVKPEKGSSVNMGFISDLSISIPSSAFDLPAFIAKFGVSVGKGASNSEAWEAAKGNIGSSASDMIKNGYKLYAKKLLEERKKMDEALTKSYKRLVDKKSYNSAEVEKMDNYSKALNWNMKVVHAYIRIWSEFTTACLKYVFLGKSILGGEKAEAKKVAKTVAQFSGRY